MLLTSPRKRIPVAPGPWSTLFVTSASWISASEPSGSVVSFAIEMARPVAGSTFVTWLFETWIRW